MGLDMCVYKIHQNTVINNGTDMMVTLSDDGDDGDETLQLFYYWINHPDLHAWFLNLYFTKLRQKTKKIGISL